MSDDYPYDVFISYARKDAEYAERVQRILEAAKFKVWRDVRDLDPHQDFTSEIERAIEKSERVVCCITPDVNRDDSFVRREISYSLALKKPIIPLIFEGTLPPIHIINVTRIDFTLQPFEAASDQLLLRLRRSLNEDQTAQQITPPDDPYRNYLNNLYERLNDDLEARVFALLELRSLGTPEAVKKKMLVSMTGERLLFNKKTKAEAAIPFENFHQAYDKYNGRVLLLGEPGAGKTVTLLAFARDAVTHRLEDPKAPLPIFAMIPTWDAEKQLSLADWLGEQVSELGTQKITKLMGSGQALLLLDGLDEIGTERETEETKEKIYPTKRFIEKFIAEIGDNSAIITCRIEDYEAIGEKLTLEGAVTLRRLDNNQLRDYLREIPILLEALDHDEALRDLVRTPLVLSVFTFAYSEASSTDLTQLQNLGDGSWEIQDKIFDTFFFNIYGRETKKRNTVVSRDALITILGRLAVNHINNIYRPDHYISEENVQEISRDRVSALDVIQLAERLYFRTFA